ncbi:MASE4 domain-containing protein [Escherichia coli]|uniref:MASE4 domain-containing protein n=1 Tax=Escherichia coli TaxID=562 RepID=UPI000BE1C777|nr:MASE4 domain-containing protein [Escherichia coli]CAD6081793.1 Uncharacterised protein [Escherichia coli]CAD6086529.1 Uncharacterised protein [Escherichia coli]CAD6149531.1 Uncharacterised protein [Escherichia coli]
MPKYRSVDVNSSINPLFCLLTVLAVLVFCLRGNVASVSMRQLTLVSLFSILTLTQLFIALFLFLSFFANKKQLFLLPLSSAFFVSAIYQISILSIHMGYNWLILDKLFIPTHIVILTSFRMLSVFVLFAMAVYLWLRKRSRITSTSCCAIILFVLICSLVWAYAVNNSVDSVDCIYTAEPLIHILWGGVGFSLDLYNCDFKCLLRIHPKRFSFLLFGNKFIFYHKNDFRYFL